MKVLLLTVVLFIYYDETSSAALDHSGHGSLYDQVTDDAYGYDEAEITVPIASTSSTRKPVGFRSFVPINGVDGDFLTWVHTVAFEKGKDAWFKLELGATKAISKVLIVNRYFDQLEFSGFMCGMTEAYYKKEDCVGAVNGLTISIYNDDKLVHECGTIEGNTEKSMASQMYYVDCGNAEGNVVMASRQDVISFTDLIMYQFVDGAESEVPMPQVSMNTWRPIDLQDGHDFTPENAVDKDLNTFIHTIVNPRVESYFKFYIGSDRSINRVEIVNRYFESLRSMNLPCGLMAFYSDTFCVGHINGLRAEVWTDDSKNAYCGTIEGNAGESLEDQTYRLDCGGARGNTVMMIRKMVVIFVEIRVFERISGTPDAAAAGAVSALQKSMDTANWTLGTGGLISAGFRPVSTGDAITK